MQQSLPRGEEMCFPKLPLSLVGEESGTTSVFFTGLNLATKSVRLYPARADNPLTLTALWDSGGEERCNFYMISLEPGPGAGHTEEHSLSRLAYYP